MSRLQVKLGAQSSIRVIAPKNPLADAITSTLNQPQRFNLKRAGIVPSVALVSSLVTVNQADAAVFEVENLNDAGAGSLRQAILDANANPGPDAVTFGGGLTGTITLTSGSMTIADDMLLQGPGSDNITVSGDDSSRVFLLDNGSGDMARVDISGITVSNGYTDESGAGIYNIGAEALSVRDAVITSNLALVNGGGISSRGGVLRVMDSTVSNNTSQEGSGAGIRQDGGSVVISGSTIDSNDAAGNGLGGGYGGGIYATNLSSLVIDDSTISNNTSYYSGGGLATYSMDGSILVSNSNITGNAGNRGGGLAIRSFEYYADGITLDNTQVTGNSSSRGGGIEVLDGSLTIRNNSLISNNTAQQGGGIFFNEEYAGQMLDIDNSTISNNTATSGYGGGVFFYAANPDLRIRNSTISGNYASGGGGGIAIYYNEGAGSNEGFITIQNTVVSNNTAGAEGGGLMLEVDEIYKPILIEDSEFSGNVAEDDGGGLHFYFDDGLYTGMIIRRTTIANNTADEGGGLWFYDDDGYSVVIENSTISGNSAVESGGGVWFYSDDGAPLILNSTVSGNSAGNRGGGLFLTHEDGDARIDNSTIVDNYAGNYGGGIFATNYMFGMTSFAIRSSIVANNSAGSAYDDISGPNVYAQFNLIETAEGAIFNQNINNLFYDDPLVGPLADNGGPTLTHALLAGSPAIDAGLNAAPAADDQRGIGFDRMIGLQTDIGAVESDTDAALTFPAATQIVTNLDDAGAGSLRQALIDANNNPGLDVVEFQPGLTGTITLTSGGLDVTDDLVINAPVPSVITISGDVNNRGIDPNEQKTLSIKGLPDDQRGPMNGPALMSVDLIGLTITDGYSGTDGGAIYSNNAELTVRDSVITGNSAADEGGGIFQYRGVLRVIDSTISNNYVVGEGYGGGIALNSADEGIYGSIVVRDSMITGNSAYEGGGIFTNYGGSLAIDNSTISNNTATGGDGGGILIENLGGSVSISNSTLSGNYAYGGRGGAITVYELDENYNLNLTLDNTTVSGNSAYGGSGGGIFFYTENDRLEIVNNSMITGNTTDRNGGGIAFYADEDGAGLTVLNSTISNNYSQNDGGGIHIYSEDFTLRIADSTISNNTAYDEGGGVHIYYYYMRGSIQISGSTFDGNRTEESDGGAIHVAGADIYATILIENSIISNNYAADDGGGLFIYADEGIYNSRTVIRNTTFSGNSASANGGGIFFYDDDGFSSLIVENSTLSGNSAGESGGGLFIYTDDAGMVIRNSTISNNTADQYGGGVFLDYIEEPRRIENSTITGNQADTGGGIATTESFPSPITLRSSIISGNTATTAGQDIGGNPGNGATFYFEFSLLGDSTDTGDVTVADNGFNLFDVDPLLAPLADNGGPTQTHALMPGSPAINQGLNFAASVDDQRLGGFPRTVGARTDMGAFEAIANPNLATALTGSPIAENGGVGTINATLTEAAGRPVIIDLDFSGTAILDTDFTVDSGALFIPDGDLATQAPVTITGMDDNITEGDEPFTVDNAVLGGAVRGGLPQLNGVIADNEGPPTVQLSLTGSPVAENGGTATVTATLSNPSTQAVTANLATSGTADASDFTLPTSITVPALGLTADITLTAVDDALDEPDETVVIDIDTVTNGVEDGVQQQTATITDDDAPPLVTITLSIETISEGGDAEVILTLNAPSGQDIDVELGFTGTATMPDDYTVSSNMVNIPAGQTTGSVFITAVDDGPGDPDETIIIDIVNVVNAVEDGVQQGILTLLEPIEVPTMSTWGKIAMVLMLPFTAFMAMRRRRQPK